MSEYKPIPIDAARQFGEIYGKVQVVIWAWDAAYVSQHVTTWGDSPTDKQIAADVGNQLKAAVGWPENMCEAVPVLFEAAPDLLEAAKFVLKYDSQKLGSIGESLLKSAIAKAERQVQA